MGILSDFREVLKELKHKKVGEATIKVCPKCGSKKIIHTDPRLYGITPRQYVCKECGYMGPIVMELTMEETG